MSSIFTKDPANKVFIALDYDNMNDALRLVERVGDTVRNFKIGMQMFYKVGPIVLERLHQEGCRIFLDSKFHDIPNTVAGASDSATSHGVYMFNVHASGGMEMMRRTKAAAEDRARKMGTQPPLVIAVTQLTSTSEDMMNSEIGVPGTVQDCVVRYAKMAQEAGLDGVVASGHEIQAIRSACGDDFVTVIPGIRPAWAAANDQSRMMTPKQAIDAGAHYLVIGRAVTSAQDPRDAMKRILDEMA